MAKELKIVNGLIRSVDLPGIYDKELEVVASSPGAGQILPVAAGGNVTLPDSGNFVGDELRVDWNGQMINDVVDYIPQGVAPHTQVQFTFDLEAGDRIRFYKIREE